MIQANNMVAGDCCKVRRGVDGVYFAFHKSQQFLGLSQLPTFMTNNVIKEPNIEKDIVEYKAHLTKVFG